MNLVEPYDLRVAADGDCVKLWMEFQSSETALPDGTFYGVTMTVEEARVMAKLILREAALAENRPIVD